MPEDLDALLRRAMKTLDDEAPSGYFDTLPDRTVARLSGGEVAMQQTGTTKREDSSAAPPIAEATAPRDEDSGLHDIRNLAQSTKQRLSKRTTIPPISDDVLSSSSASWKNLALPQPAKMVSLPSIEDLPSKQEIAARDKAAKVAAKQAKNETKNETKTEAAPVSAPISASAVEASASGRVDYKPAFSTLTQPKPKASSSNKTRNIALIGMGLAAAAGITIFVVTQKSGDVAQPVTTASAPAGAANGVSAERMKELDDATAKLNAEHARAQIVEATPPAPAVDQAVGAATGAPEEQPKPVDHAKAPVVMTKRGVGGGGKSKNDAKPETVTAEKPEATKAGKGGAGAGEGEDKDFNALLKEAGVDGKKDAKPKLDKKQLSTDEFKKGMAAITAKAQACFKGTQGSANVKLTIAPSGSVSKVTVTGTFAGMPEADCVSAAVKAASFPAWDGSPQSFGYPILLSE
jgi:hypothetical protein